MFDRKRMLLIHGADPKRWARRWGIEPFTAPCCICKVPQTTSIPFACGTLRGLMAPKCACGHPRPPYCVVRDPRFGDLFTGGVRGA